MLLQSNTLMYTTEDGITKIEVIFDHNTDWLPIEQMAGLFPRDKSAVGKPCKEISITYMLFIGHPISIPLFLFRTK